MKLTFIVTAILLMPSFPIWAQSTKMNRLIDLTANLGNSEGTVAFSYINNWKTGKARKLELGLGLRLTSYTGHNRDFTTAPARLSRSTTTPFLTVLSGQETQNWDTLTVQRPFVNSLNLSANVGYNFSAHWGGGFNIDLIGFSFGPKRASLLTSNGIASYESNTKPTVFNLLLTGDNDLGSLNSAFFLKYKLNPNWGIKFVYEFYFAEYKSNTIVQIAPDGTKVDRFRNKVNALGLGISYHFNK
jgi:hypothetical protein